MTPHGVGLLDVGVEGEKIACLASPGSLTLEGRRVIEAQGKIVVPGGIDPHVHQLLHIAQHPELNYSSLGPEEDTVGMAYGGVTTHLDFCFLHPGEGFARSLEERDARWKGSSMVDYSFHVGLLGEHALSAFEEIPEVVAEGYPSFKVFTLEIRKGFRLDFGRIGLAMERIAASGGIVAVHGEDDDLVRFNYEKAEAEGRTEGWRIAEVRSKLSEQLAFWRTILLAEAKRAAVYFVHTSASEGVEAIRRARARGLPVYGETLHHYACRTAEDYRAPRGYCHHTYPSLKYPEDRDALWGGLLDGTLSATATDELPTSLEVKLKGETIRNLTGGNLGAEARMGVVYTEGVSRRGMSLERFVDVTSANAARIFGLYPRKGALAVGSDADLAILDPSIRRALRAEDFHVSDYSPWEGWEVHAWPVTTILRGKVLVEGGTLQEGAAGSGRRVPRKIQRQVLERPVC